MPTQNTVETARVSNSYSNIDGDAGFIPAGRSYGAGSGKNKSVVHQEKLGNVILNQGRENKRLSEIGGHKKKRSNIFKNHQASQPPISILEQSGANVQSSKRDIANSTIPDSIVPPSK